METVTVENKKFKLFLSEINIQKRIEKLASEIESKYCEKNPIFLCVLNGSFYFTADLLKHFSFPYEISFVRVKSYDGMHSSNNVKEFIGLQQNVDNRHIVIIEDIVESGLTTHYLLNKLEDLHPASLSIATLLYKPTQLRYPNLPVDYIGFEISEEFVIGYGLDLNEKARGLRSIYQLELV